MAGFRELLAIEWDAGAAATFRLNFPDVPVYEGDIRDLSAERCMELAGVRPRELDVLDGSPPCQGFSTAGKRRLMDPRNSLFAEFARLLRGLRPRAFVLENVTGLVKGYMKQVYLAMMAELRGCGYRAQGEVMNAMWFGVPQRRERVIVIGVRDDLGVEPSHPRPQDRPVSAGEAIRGILNNQSEVAWLLECGRKYVAFQDWVRIPIGQNRQQALGKSGYNCCKWNPARPAQTIRHNDGHITMHGAMHWAEPRRFTIAEFKRFASFPDDFQFVGGYKAVQVIGNSVPPNLMRAIALHVRAEILERAGEPGARPRVALHG